MAVSLERVHLVGWLGHLKKRRRFYCSGMKPELIRTYAFFVALGYHTCMERCPMIFLDVQTVFDLSYIPSHSDSKVANAMTVFSALWSAKTDGLDLTATFEDASSPLLGDCVLVTLKYNLGVAGMVAVGKCEFYASDTDIMNSVWGFVRRFVALVKVQNG